MGFEGDQEFAKPSPHGVLSVLENFNYDRNIHRALMIGDSISDIRAAKKAHISACLIKREKLRYDIDTSRWDFQPDYIIESLDKILEL
jgi:phosphoglycolate phosphatase-like HAD superfamily hydrolase